MEEYCAGKKLKLSVVQGDQHERVEDDPVEKLFNKKVQITGRVRYELPRASSMFRQKPWTIPSLQALKKELNSVKNRLNDYNLDEWHVHTRQRNKAGAVLRRLRKEIKPEFITQAWCKFYEIVHSFPLVPIEEILKNGNAFTSVHLCEAPGAFVASLNHWLKCNKPSVQWDWMATTLNPYYEGNSLSVMIDDDRLIRHTMDHWCFGADNTGNLMDLKNLDDLVAKASKRKGKVLLVTADGSIDCMNVPDEQESLVAHLHFCETVAALHLLSAGGSFLLKVFTIFECHSICLMYLLSCCFEDVWTVKPATSKEGNSEMYVVCLRFKGEEYIKPYLGILREHYETDLDVAMFREYDVKLAFLKKIRDCSNFFKSHQCEVILNNIDTFKSNNNNVSSYIIETMEQMQQMVADTYIKRYNLQPLYSDRLEIVGKVKLERTMLINSNRKVLHESFSERCKKLKSEPEERLLYCLNDAKEIAVNTQPNAIIECKLCDGNLIEYLNILYGKPFHRVYSSRFCDEQVLNIQTTANNIVNELHGNIQFPTKEATDELLKTINLTSKYKTLTFRYTDIYRSHRIVRSICNELNTLSPGESLVLIGYSLLTQLNVGLLYIIGHLFTSTKFKVHSTVGCLIILKCYCNNEDIKYCLKQITEADEYAQANCKEILSVLHISVLCDWDLFPLIVDLNHWIIKSYVTHAVNAISCKHITESSNNLNVVSNV